MPARSKSGPQTQADLAGSLPSNRNTTPQNYWSQLNTPFAIFVLTPDDEVKYRGARVTVPRDNLIFELGLSIAQRGLKRTFIVYPKDPKVKLPTDLHGVVYIPYSRPRGKTLRSAIKPACDQIRPRIQKQGIRPERQSKVTIAFVANLGTEFNQEVLQGFRNDSDTSRIEEIESTELRHSDDDASFKLAMEKAAHLNTQFVVLVPPNKEVWKNSDISKILLKITERQTRVIIIENAPADIANKQYGGLVTSIHSDSENGAQLLAEHAISSKRVERVLVINGPRESDNAAIRARIFRDRFKRPPLTSEFRDSDGWAGKQARRIVESYLNNSRIPDLIVCGNDEMALAAAEALASSGPEGRNCRVFGYDGIVQALFAIADKWNPFCATIRIPTSLYGRYVVNLINRVQERHQLDPRNRIPISKGNLVTSETIEHVLKTRRWVEQT